MVARSRILFGSAFLIALGAADASARADALPATSLQQSITITNACTGQEVNVSTFGTFSSGCTVSMPIPGSLFGQTTIDGTQIVAEAAVSPHTAGSIAASAQESYFVEVVGPSIVSVPVFIQGSGSTDHPEVAANSGAGLTIGVPNAGFIVDECASSSPTLACGQGAPLSFDINGSFLLPANTPIEVSIFAVADAASPGFAQGFVQPLPTFTVDPNFPNADQYSIIFSAGLPSIPEPATGGLICAGIASLWLFRRRRAA